MVVRMRSTKSHSNNRRAHDGLASPSITLDKSTNVSHLRHRASLVTGQYRGRQVIDIQGKIAKRLKKDKQVKAEGR